MNALEIAALGLRHDNERLKVTAHNLANLTTPGFKREVMVQGAFASTMDAMAASQLGGATHTDTRAGKLSPTGRPLDIALPEGRYLLVEREDGSMALTRQGSLQLDAQGGVRTLSGHKVLGNQGTLQSPRDTQALSFDRSGRLLADGRAIDTLRMVSLKPNLSVLPLGDGLFAADPAQWANEAGVSELQSGHLEASNVVSSQEMVNLMTTTRHAESMVRLIQAADEMMEKAIRRFGETA